MNGCVVWITGLPSSGKSTLGKRLRERLRAEGRCSSLLDGDAVREVLVPKPAYSEEAREAFYATLAGLAALLAADGAVVIVAATSHLRRFRERARGLAPAFLEVLVDVDVEECARRDAKGLYQAARAGRVRDLPGLDAAYERPPAPDVIARGGLDDDAIQAIVAWINNANEAR